MPNQTIYQHMRNHVATIDGVARSYNSAAAPMNTAAAKAVPDSWRSETAAPVWTAEEAVELPEGEEPPELEPEEPELELEEPVACEAAVEAAVTKPEPVVVVVESEVLVEPEEALDSSV